MVYTYWIDRTFTKHLPPFDVALHSTLPSLLKSFLFTDYHTPQTIPFQYHVYLYLYVYVYVYLIMVTIILCYIYTRFDSALFKYIINYHSNIQHQRNQSSPLELNDCTSDLISRNLND